MWNPEKPTLHQTLIGLGVAFLPAEHPVHVRTLRTLGTVLHSIARIARGGQHRFIAAPADGARDQPTSTVIFEKQYYFHKAAGPCSRPVKV